MFHGILNFLKFLFLRRSLRGPASKRAPRKRSTRSQKPPKAQESNFTFNPRKTRSFEGRGYLKTRGKGGCVGSFLTDEPDPFLALSDSLNYYLSSHPRVRCAIVVVRSSRRECMREGLP